MLTPVVAEVPEGETLTLHGGGLSVSRDTARGDLPRCPWPPSRPQWQPLSVRKRLTEAGGATVLYGVLTSGGFVDSVWFLIPRDSLAELESHQAFGPRVTST